MLAVTTQRLSALNKALQMGALCTKGSERGESVAASSPRVESASARIGTRTTSDSAAVGDVVVVKGTVRLDKDFGAGYAYPVIVEDAKITK